MVQRQSRNQGKELLDEAAQLVKKGIDAVAFSEHFFGPSGRLRSLWDTDEERRKLVNSRTYKMLQRQFAVLRSRDATSFEQDMERLSGRLTITVPKSLHAALRTEAAQEGESLSELIRLKMGISYRQFMYLMTTSEPLRKKIA